jgi:peptidoglycan/LPS O-acetylase OafA/YrhL
MLKQGAMQTTERNLLLVTVAVGVAVWLIPWVLLAGREAWDHWTYFIISVPAMSVIAGYAGFRAKFRSWRWPLTLVLAQFATALLLGGFGNLLPLGIVVFMVFAVPMFITAAVGAWIARRREQHAS